MPQPYTLIPSNGSDPADEWVRLGIQAHTEGKLDQAENSYRQALRVDPQSIIATQNLAVALATKGNLNEALLTVERAAMQDGDTALIHANRALIALEADRIDEALESADQAVKIAEEHPIVAYPDPTVQTLIVKALIAATAGKAGGALDAYQEVLTREPLHPMAGPNACFIQSLVDSPPEERLEQRRRYAVAHRQNLPPQPPHRNDRNPDRVLRVGYVGGDFKTHSAAMIFGNVLLNHDPKQVEHYIYSSLPVDAKQDEMTKRFFNSVGYPVQHGVGPKTGSNDGTVVISTNRWRDISSTGDDQAAEMIRKDGIDILVDLAAHTGGGRLGIFVRKPAPVQVTAWGFAHGTGMEEIDYFFADPVAVPASERNYYAEEIIELPCIVSYLPPNYQVRGTSTAPMASRGHFTFGSYARYEKLSDECLRTFAEILQRVPDSRLQFKDHAFRRPYSIRRVLSFMEGIDPKRLLFSISTNHQDHMLAYQQCDLCLDPWPHGGGVVFLEQMWMGVPTLTLRGKQPAGRTGASVLTAIGHTDFIADTVESFVDKAVGIATREDWTRRTTSLRRTLRDEFMKSPVVAGYPQAVERAYRETWYNWCKGR